MAQPEKPLILLQLDISCNARPPPPLPTQPQLTLKCTFTSPNGFRRQGQMHGVMVETPQQPHQQKPIPLSPSAPDQTFPTISLSTKQAECHIFAAEPKDFGSYGCGSREWVTYSAGPGSSALQCPFSLSIWT